MGLKKTFIIQIRKRNVCECVYVCVFMLSNNYCVSILCELEQAVDELGTLRSIYTLVDGLHI